MTPSGPHDRKVGNHEYQFELRLHPYDGIVVTWSGLPEAKAKPDKQALYIVDVKTLTMAICDGAEKCLAETGGEVAFPNLRVIDLAAWAERTRNPRAQVSCFPTCCDCLRRCPYQVRCGHRCFRSAARLSGKVVRMDGEQDGAQAQGEAVEGQQDEPKGPGQPQGQARERQTAGAVVAGDGSVDYQAALKVKDARIAELEDKITDAAKTSGAQEADGRRARGVRAEGGWRPQREGGACPAG